MKTFKILVQLALGASMIVGCASSGVDEEKAEAAANAKAGTLPTGLAPKAVGGAGAIQRRSAAGSGGASFQ